MSRPPASVLPPCGRILAVDSGTRRIGVALSDPARMLAQPLTTLESRGPRKDVDALVALAREHAAVGIVVGLPVNMDGSHGAAYDEAGKLMERLQTASGLPVFGWDERLTSAQAERMLTAAGVRSSKRRRQGAVDRVAAALLLEAFLASLASPDADGPGGHEPG